MHFISEEGRDEPCCQMEMGMIFLMLYKTILFLFQFYTQKPNFEACQVILMSILVLNFSAAELS